MAPDPLSSRSLARSAASASAATMTSRVLGLVREQVLASFFGASTATDAFNVAFRVPNLLRDLFAEGAMSAAFVPTFTGRLTTAGKPAAFRLANAVITTLVLVTLALVALGFVFTEPLVRLLAFGYAESPEQVALTVSLTRIMLPFLTCIAVAAAFMGMLNALGHFFVPAFAPAMFNVASITCAVVLVPVMLWLGLPGITAMAIGTLAGGLAQLILQWPLLRREGFRFSPVVDWRDEGLRRVLVLMGPGMIGMAATQVNVFVNTALATGQETGAVSWLNYAFRLMYLPIGLFGVSVATAALPTVSRQVAAEDRGAIGTTIANGLTLMLMLNVPATVGLIALGAPIVRVIFERGAFSPADTVATAAALQFYAVGLVGYSVVRIVSPVFYALGRSRTPVAVSVAAVLVNAALNLLLVRVLGYRGLALGTSIAALVNAGALLVLLSRATGGIALGRVAWTLAKIGAASAVMALVVLVADERLTAWLDRDGLVSDVLALSVTIALGVAALAATALALRIPEFGTAVAAVTRRLRAGRRPARGV